ncbi:MAG: hypothetical protein WDM81_02360 [Rhizomicrobium sp.]
MDRSSHAHRRTIPARPRAVRPADDEAREIAVEAYIYAYPWC